MKRFVILIIGLVCMHFGAMAQNPDNQQIQKLNYVYQQIRDKYVDDVPLDPLVEEAIIATLKELDPHSAYLDKEQMANLRSRLRGEYAGVGIKYIIFNDTLVVRGVVANSPAERAKLEINDRIISVDGRTIIGINPDSIPSILKGEAGTKLSIEVKRRCEAKPLKINLKRDDIESSAISVAFRYGNVGYISISKFSKPLPAEFYEAYRALGNIESLIIDLRDNVGGAINSAIDLSGLFLRKGDVVVSTEGRTGCVVYDKKRDGQLLDTPLVVIINENSASASEIFAGAMQDHDRGVIVGRTSFGKGLVQRVIDFKDGTGMCLTVSRYKTPSGRIIQRPYTMGDGDSYNRDTLRFLHPDSLAHNPNLLFKTLKLGRTIYGGGGITPDCYIAYKPTKVDTILSDMVHRGVVERIVVEYFDRVSASDVLKCYPTLEDFASQFKLDGDAEASLEAMIADCESEVVDEVRGRIQKMICGVIADAIYYDGAYSYIYGMSYDDAMCKAFELLFDNSKFKAILNEK